jgi:lysozyme
MITNIKDQLKRDEGVRLVPYKDSRGFNTVAVGHNLDANPLPGETYPMTMDRVEQILDHDLEIITNKLISDLPWVAQLPDVYKGVLQNMAFNMGAKGEEAFHHMLAELQIGNYAQAAIDGTNSAWYHQVGNRAVRLMEQLRTGVWQ